MVWMIEATQQGYVFQCSLVLRHIYCAKNSRLSVSTTIATS